MRALVRAVAGLALAATALVVPAASAAADATTFSIVNSASYETAALARGSLVTIFTSRSVSDLPDQPFVPWRQELPDQLSVEASCGSSYDQPMKLPISYIGRSGRQLNAYYPNDIGDEPWGRCSGSGGSLITVRMGSSHGGATIARTMQTVEAHPGVFFEGDNVPAGDHVAALYPYPRTRLSTCVNLLPANPGMCRASTIGLPARLTLTLTGAEFFVGNPDKLAFELARVEDGVIVTPYVKQTLECLTIASQGAQTATVALRPGTAGGEYRLRVTNSVHSVSTQLLKVEFGDPI